MQAKTVLPVGNLPAGSSVICSRIASVCNWSLWMTVIVICICCYSLESLSAVNHCHNDLLKPVTALLLWKLKVTVYLFLSDLVSAIPKHTCSLRAHARVTSMFLQLTALSFSAVLKSFTQNEKTDLHLLTAVWIQTFQFIWNIKGKPLVSLLIPCLCNICAAYISNNMYRNLFLKLCMHKMW